MDSFHHLILETLQMNKQALVFVPSRASAEKTAEDIARLTNSQLPDLENEVLHAASSPTQQCKKLAQCIRKGVAFHHAGLLQQQKELIEENFRNGKVKIICCTPTLAAGLSLPAFRVIISSLKRFSASEGMDWIPVLEYLQMAGRAGRPEYESFGEAIAIAKTEAEQEEIYDRYIQGVPEEIYSKLAVEPVLRTYLLSLITSGIIRDTKSMMQFFSKTFWAHQFKDMQELQRKMEKMLVVLEEWQLVRFSHSEKNAGTENSSEFVIAQNMLKTSHSQKEKKRWASQIFQATPIGKRVSELYLDPLTARHLLDCLLVFTPSKNSFSLLQMISQTLEMRPLLRTRKREEEHLQEELNTRCGLLLKEEPSPFHLEYAEFIDAFKTALFFEAWTQERDEAFLFETFDIRPGEIHMKLEIADWLLYASDELAKVLDLREVRKSLAQLRVQVRYGVKEELLPLIKLQGIGRVRARKLFAHGIFDLGKVRNTDSTSLAQILGSKAVAEEVKKQVGEDIQEVPAGKRIGQLSMEKFV